MNSFINLKNESVGGINIGIMDITERQIIYFHASEANGKKMIINVSDCLAGISFKLIQNAIATKNIS